MADAAQVTQYADGRVNKACCPLTRSTLGGYEELLLGYVDKPAARLSSLLDSSEEYKDAVLFLDHSCLSNQHGR